jgi:hypothetical protein
MARLDANHKEMMAEMKACQEEMDTKTEDIRAETKAIQAKMEAMRDNRTEANMKAWREETMSYQIMMTACLDSKEPNPEGMKPEAEHREVPKEDAIGKPVKQLKK